MPVAKSYQSFKIDGEPFTTNGRQYVKLSNGKTVRWYSDSEYKKLYPEAVSIEKPKRSLKDILGFEKGFITIFKGETYPHLEWFQASIARYNKVWGWFIPSEIEVPQDVPVELEAKQLLWSEIAADDNTLHAESIIAAAVDELLCDESPSVFIGTVGDRIEIEVVVKKAIESNGYYGRSTFHIFETDDGNILTWSTATKNLSVGKRYKLRGTIKDHDTYKKCKQTVLTRCAILSEEN